MWPAHGSAWAAAASLSAPSSAHHVPSPPASPPLSSCPIVLGASKLPWISGERGSLEPHSPKMPCSEKRPGWAKVAESTGRAQASYCLSQDLSLPVLTMDTSQLSLALTMNDPAILLLSPPDHSPDSLLLADICSSLGPWRLATPVCLFTQHSHRHDPKLPGLL